MSCPFRAAIVLAATLVGALPPTASASHTVLLDTFDDDPLGGPPAGPEIGAYSVISPAANFDVIALLGNQRVNIRDVSATGGYLLGYTPTGPAVHARTTYTFRDLSTTMVGANAFQQSLTLAPAGALYVYWGNDNLIRVRFIQGAVDNTWVSAFAFALNTDYFVELETDALADRFSLTINGTSVFANQALGSDVTQATGFTFASNFPTQGTTQVDSVRMVEEFDPCDNDHTPPLADIDLPPSFACVCNPVTITGTANDPDGTFDHYTLEYQAANSNAWTVITNSLVPVVNGVLAVWNTGGLAQGYYILRLTVTNDCGLSSTDVRVVSVDNAFDTLVVNYPAEGAIVGGYVCFDGTVYDGCYQGFTIQSVPASAFDPLPGPVINDPFAHWPTTLTADGPYTVTVTGTTVCGATASVVRHLTVDNTPPVAVITSPQNCDNVSGVVPIVGTVNDLHFQLWTLQYTGGNQNGWVTIATGNNPVVNGVIANWNTAGLIPCAYTLRLVAYDYSLMFCSSYYQYTEFYTSVTVGLPRCCPGDVNGDGIVDFDDIDPFVALLGVTCP